MALRVRRARYRIGIVQREARHLVVVAELDVHAIRGIRGLLPASRRIFAMARHAHAHCHGVARTESTDALTQPSPTCSMSTPLLWTSLYNAHEESTSAKMRSVQSSIIVQSA